MLKKKNIEQSLTHFKILCKLLTYLLCFYPILDDKYAICSISGFQSNVKLAEDLIKEAEGNYLKIGRSEISVPEVDLVYFFVRGHSYRTWEFNRVP